MQIDDNGQRANEYTSMYTGWWELVQHGGWSRS